MLSSKVWIVLRKELREHFRKPRAYLPLAAMPLFMVAINLYILHGMLQTIKQGEMEILKGFY